MGCGLGVGGRQLGEVAEGGKLGVVCCGSSTSGDELFQLLELPFRALQELEACRGALVLVGFEPGAKRLEAILHGTMRLAPARARLFEGVGGADQLLEAKDRGEGVEELRRTVLEHRAELVVGEEGTVGRERLFPSELRQGRALGVVDDARFAVVEVLVGAPCAAHDIGTGLSIDEKTCLEARSLRGMEVAPALAPNLRAPRAPALVVACEQKLKGLSEARLSRSVTADDQGQARSGRERELRSRTDSPKPLGLDRVDVGPNGLGGLNYVGTRSFGRLPAQALFDLAEERSEHETRDGFGEFLLGIESSENVLDELAPHHRLL